jgi:uncharacterized membrane protein YfcA
MPITDNLPVSVKTLLLVALGIITIAYIIFWLVAVRRARANGTVMRSASTSETGEAGAPGPFHLAIGFVTNFFDTLGIGSFATTTSIFKFAKLVPDRVIPGTLNVGHTLPTVAQAFIYMSLVEVGPKTLVLLIAASVMGAWLGAGIVAGWPKRKVQIGMGCALLAAATLMLMTQLKVFPGGGDALSIDGVRLAIGVGGNFMLGALMTIGIGLYAPCMILISLLGMNPTAAFPIMMGSCAFLMPASSVRFIRKDSYHLRAALGLMIGGVPGVLLAAYIVKSLPIGAVRWLVVGVVLYTATMMLRSARNERQLAARGVEDTAASKAASGP